MAVTVDNLPCLTPVGHDRHNVTIPRPDPPPNAHRFLWTSPGLKVLRIDDCGVL